MRRPGVRLGNLSRPRGAEFPFGISIEDNRPVGRVNEQTTGGESREHLFGGGMARLGKFLDRALRLVELVGAEPHQSVVDGIGQSRGTHDQSGRNEQPCTEAAEKAIDMSLQEDTGRRPCDRLRCCSGRDQPCPPHFFVTVL